MHIGIICPELTGHLNPMLSLGRELLQRGHQVSVVASGYSAAAIQRYELGHLEIPRTDSQGWDACSDWQRVGEKSGIRALLHTLKIFRRLATYQREQATDLIRAERVDALIVDQFSTGGALVADALRLPLVVACNALASQRDLNCPPPTLSWKYRPTGFGRLRNRLGYGAARLLSEGMFGQRKPGFVSPLMLMIDPEPWGLAQISQQPAFFDFPHESLPNHFHYTGPWHETGRDPDVHFDWGRLDDRPLVYASLGTLQNKLRHVYEAIVEAVRGLDLQLVLALGSRDAQLDVEPTDNVFVVPYAPQLRLLDRASVAMTHAGLNTALECLTRGVPMVCVPVTNDQPGVARRVEWLGAGVYVPLRWAGVRRLRRALLSVLNQPSYRNVARHCQAKLAQTNGLALAANIVEEAFATGRRIRSR